MGGELRGQQRTPPHEQVSEACGKPQSQFKYSAQSRRDETPAAHRRVDVSPFQQAKDLFPLSPFRLRSN
eukprot:1709902-Pyramimonas_sp.AAC.1